MTDAEQTHSLRSLVTAVEAIKNWRALLLLAGTCCVAFFCAYTIHSQSYSFITLFGLVLAFVIFCYGQTATGIMLMDMAKTGTPRSMGNSLLSALVTGHNVIFLALINLLTLVVVGLVARVLLTLGLIPRIGDLLSFFLFPLCILLLSGTLFFLTLLMLFASAAIWNGEPLTRAVTNAFAILRKRLCSALLKQILLAIVAASMLFIISSIMLGGTGITTALQPHPSLDAMLSDSMPGSTSPMDFDGFNRPMQPNGFGGMARMARPSGFGMMRGMGMGPSLGFGVDALLGNLINGIITASILMAIASLIPVIIAMQGNCAIYLESINGLDLLAEEAKFRGTLNLARQKVEEVRRAADEARKTQTPPPPAAAKRCPGCNEPIGSDDVFCGNCGHKLL